MQTLIHTLRTAADTSGGLALRRLLWSLWTDRLALPGFASCPRVNLWQEITSLDDTHRAEFAALLVIPEAERLRALQHILESSPEWDRIDTTAATLFRY
jgi:hypothetical protein